MKICKRCILDDHIPSVRFDENGLCNYCRQSKEKRDQKNLKEKYVKRFTELLVKYKRNDNYDCLVAFSGGKDSTYTLHLMKNEYNLSILALSFNNWFQSESAIRNIHRVIKNIGVDHLTVLPSFEAFKKIICASISQDLFSLKALERATSVCTTCLSLIRFVCLKTAIEKNISFVVFGMSPGQASLATSVFKTNVEMVKRMQNAIFNPLRKYAGDIIDRYCLEERHFEKKNSFPYIINPLAFIDYDEQEIYEHIQAMDWQPPDDTDPNSTNCLLNAFANKLHLQKYGYHPYAMEVAELVREGVLTREEALHRISEEPNQNIIEKVKHKLGL